MNLMFRKNFREGGGKSGGGCGGGGGLKGSKGFTSGGRSANKQRAREMSLSLQDDVHYRTHLFFSPSNRPCYADNEGELVLLLESRCCGDDDADAEVMTMVVVALQFAFYPTPTPSLLLLLILIPLPNPDLSLYPILSIPMLDILIDGWRTEQEREANKYCMH